MEDRLTREEHGVLAAVIAWFAVTAAWWVLALWPVADAPVWLERTRYVCFGVSETGLPDGGGWIGLIAGPLGMLSILVIGWWRAVTGIMRKSRSSIGVAGAVGTLAIGVLLLAGGAAWRVADAHAGLPNGDAPSHGLPETYPRLNTLAPALGLTSQTGEIVTLDMFAGQPVLVTFAYAHCVTVCPVVVRQTLAAQRLLAGTPSHPAVVIVTLDPWRDTPSRLPALATGWELPDRDAWVLSGKIEDVERVLTAWNIPRTRDERNGEVIHPSLVYIVQNGRIVFAATGGTEAIAELVKRL